MLIEQNDIEWSLQIFIFWKYNINYNKIIIILKKKKLIIITDSAKRCEAQILYTWCE
jgi:hypothetical protein